MLVFVVGRQLGIIERQLGLPLDWLEG